MYSNGDQETPVLISNVQVMDLLHNQLQARNSKPDNNHSSRRRGADRFRNRNWVEESVHAYLKKAPCTLLDKTRRTQLQAALVGTKKHFTPPDPVSGATRKTAGFSLTEAESLQIINFMPTEPVEIHLMIEELHARMTEKEQEELLEVIASYKVGANGEAATPVTGTAAAAVTMATPNVKMEDIVNDHANDAMEEDVAEI